MAGLHKAKGTKKLRKVGRNANSCLSYKNENRREKNKIKKLNRHLKEFDTDTCAQVALDNCKAIIGGRKAGKK
jgi:hypothetical protein